MKHFYFIFFIISLQIVLLSKVDSLENSKLLHAADLVKEGRRAEALPILLLLEKSSTKQVSVASKIILAKLYNAQAGFKEADKYLSSIDTAGLDSEIQKEYYFTKSETAYNLTLFQKSFQRLTEFYHFLNSRSDSAAFYDNLERLAVYFLDDKFLESKIQEYNGKQLSAYIMLAYAVKLRNQGIDEKAHRLLLDIIKKFPYSYPHERTMEVLAEYKEIFGGDIDKRIGVVAIVLPLTNPDTGEENIPGTQVLQGIQFAVDEFNSINGQKIGIVIYDTKGENSELIRITSEIKKLEGLQLIIGSLFSSETNILCYLLHDASVPVISPTATDDSLTYSHDNFFQANPSFSIRGESMAQYLTFTEGKKKIAVVYQDQSYAASIAFSFRKEFEKLGGKVSLFEPISSSGNEIQSITFNLAAQSLQGTEGLFFPFGDRKFISIMNSAFSKAKLKMNLYGNQDWYSLKELQLNSEITDNLVISSDYYVDYTSSAYADFAENFMNKTKNEPLRNHFYGYDLMAGLLPIIAKFPGGQLINALKKEANFDGFHNSLNFGEGRVNRYMIFFKYKSGTFDVLDRFRVGR